MKNTIPRKTAFLPFACLLLAFWNPLPSPQSALAQGAETGKPPTLVPVDESPADPAFHQFYRRFLRAVDERDAAFVRSLVYEETLLDFGGGAGLEEFDQVWNPSDPEGPLWKELDGILRLGGALEDDPESEFVFSAPYVHSRWPEEVDPLDHVLIGGRQVRFRRSPSPEGEVIREVSWEIMEMVGESDAEWVRLRAYDGVEGYVHSDFLRSPVGLRIGDLEDRAVAIVQE